MPSHVFLHVRTSKDDETKIDASAQIFSSLLPSHLSGFRRLLFGHPPTYSFEYYLLSQTIYFYAVAPAHQELFLTSLIQSSYPKTTITKTTDPLDIVLKCKKTLVGELQLKHHFSIPLRTYVDFGDIDVLSGLVGYLAKQSNELKVGIQILVSPASFPWQRSALSSGKTQVYNEKTGSYTEKSSGNQSLISAKAQLPGGKAIIRIVVGTNNEELGENYLKSQLATIASTFNVLGSGEGNGLKLKTFFFSPSHFAHQMHERKSHFHHGRRHILNAAELATLWHPTGATLAGIKNISWGKKLPGEPPASLPVALNLTENMKQTTNFFARTEFKNQDLIFGIKEADRRRHMYLIGKTGAGKSTLIANMAIDDIRRGRGLGIIDPHGDLAETLLEYIPKRRMQDVVYLEPFDVTRPFSLNVLEVKHMQHRDLVSSGIVAIFSKLYADSWGPRLEYILRNTILTLLEIPDSTLPDALRLLSDAKWRKKKLVNVKDQVLLDFWHKEFDRYTDKLRAEAVSPIQNKIGQFVSSKMIRQIIDTTKSTVDLQKIMDEKKILILNLSQGKLGEDNAALLGAMIITQIQLAAMNRAFMKEEDREDFYLYVDEFQNFATSSFIKILSEARKYRLCLTLTNQYIEQLPEEIQTAIFGNVGTLISFVMGSRDAEIFSKEYSSLYTPADLVNLGKHQVIMKLCIDNMTSSPFPAVTLPLPALKNGNKDKIIRMSKEKYGRNVEPEKPPVKPKATK